MAKTKKLMLAGIAIIVVSIAIVAAILISGAAGPLASGQKGYTVNIPSLPTDSTAEDFSHELDNW